MLLTKATTPPIPASAAEWTHVITSLELLLTQITWANKNKMLAPCALGGHAPSTRQALGRHWVDTLDGH